MIKNDGWLFNAYLLLLVWLPIPLGSNRPWAWTFIEIYSFSLLIIWIIFYAKSFNFKTIKPYLPLLIIFSIIQFWVFLQQLSMPTQLLELFNQTTANHFESTGSSFGSISLDPSHSLAL